MRRVSISTSLPSEWAPSNQTPDRRKREQESTALFGSIVKRVKPGFKFDRSTQERAVKDSDSSPGSSPATLSGFILISSSALQFASLVTSGATWTRFSWSARGRRIFTIDPWNTSRWDISSDWTQIMIYVKSETTWAMIRRSIGSVSCKVCSSKLRTARTIQSFGKGTK